MCLHPQHLCDGVVQCPQNDDELLCDVQCPAPCTCYGSAFFCQKPFHARHHATLRFLDARGSGMRVSDLVDNVMLIYLNLAASQLTSVGELRCANLRTLDLSDNQLMRIELRDLHHLPQLETLVVSGNPLLFLFQSLGLEDQTATDSQDGSPRLEAGPLYQTTTSDQMGTVASLSKNSSRSSVHISDENKILSLHTLELSRINTMVLNPRFFSLLPNLHTVNMSGGGVDTLLGAGFQALTQLRVLDLRGCPLTHFPRHMLQQLDKLETVHADNYRLCCPSSLPRGFLLENCQAPSDDISSCQSLLRSNSYRVFLSIIASMSLLGNICSFVYRVLLQNKKPLGFDVLVANLCVADFLMGVYLSVVGVADFRFQGNYLWEDNNWKDSAACHMAGFLSLVSSEVSALVICLITLDRFLVLRFPFSSFHFGAVSAQLASLCVWAAGCVLATVPLTPGVAHWHFYSQTGICIPLPVSRADFPGYTYAFGVMIVANFILFMVIAAGQVFVYWSIHANSLSSGDTTRKSKELTIARRLITVAMSDFLCWFPYGLLGVMAATGTSVPGEVNVAMAIFVLPFNSALNPFLYTLNVVLEKRRKAQEERIRTRLVAQFRSVDTGNKIMLSTDRASSRYREG